MSEILKEIAEKRKANILKSGKYFQENELYCPYCAFEQHDIWDMGLGHPNGEEEEVQCQKCERHFAVSMTIVFTGRKLE